MWLLNGDLLVPYECPFERAALKDKFVIVKLLHLEK